MQYPLSSMVALSKTDHIQDQNAAVLMLCSDTVASNPISPDSDKAMANVNIMMCVNKNYNT